MEHWKKKKNVGFWDLTNSHKKRFPALRPYAWTYYLSLHSLMYKMWVFMVSQDSVGLNVKGKACYVLNGSEAW